MIEGYLATPWFREASRRGGLGIDDCKECMRQNPQLIRQYKGCGYEPPLDPERFHLTIWQPPAGNERVGYRGPDLTVCAGYTCNLPRTIEAVMARAHWAKGNVPIDRTPEDLLDAILIVDGQMNSLQSWLMVPASEGGGGS